MHRGILCAAVISAATIITLVVFSGCNSGLKPKGEGLLAMRIEPNRSMDEIDNESFGAGPRPFDTPAQPVDLKVGTVNLPSAAPVLSLDGDWELAEGGAEAARLAGTAWNDGIPTAVPGSVHTALQRAGRIPDQTFGKNQVAVYPTSFKTYWMRRTFVRPQGRGPFHLNFGGVAIHCMVWVNGTRLGEHEGMFGGPRFDITEYLRDENTVVVKINPAPLRIDERPGPNNGQNVGWQDTVVFNNCYGWHYAKLPSLGVWRGVAVTSSPTARLADPFVVTRDALKGLVDLVADLDREQPGRVVGEIAPENFKGQRYRFEHRVARGRHVHLALAVPDPQAWWPVDHGEPNLYRMKLAFLPDGGGTADVHDFTFGLRTIEMRPLPGGPRPDKFNWTFVINGQPMFIKGTGWCTLDPLMDFRRERYETFLTRARQEHCMMLRAWGSGMPETDDFYDLCDRLGIMVMQEWPTAADSHKVQPFTVLEETVRLNTLRLRNRPSWVITTGGNESPDPFGPAINMMGRLGIELDGTRPFHRGEPWGGSKHEYNAYWASTHPDEHVLSTADFYGEFGMPSFPVWDSVQRYLPADEKNLWPPKPNGALLHHTPTFNTPASNLVADFTRFSQGAGYFLNHTKTDLKRFITASQLCQVVVLRHELERARTRWPQCTGAIFYKLNDNYPAASFSTVDWYGAPKIAHWFVRDSYAPLGFYIVFPRLNSFGTRIGGPMFVVDDTDALKGKKWAARVRMYGGDLKEVRHWEFTGEDSVGRAKQVGKLNLGFEETETTPMFFVAELEVDGRQVFRTFYFLNYEHVRGSLFELPRTTLKLETRGREVTVTNTGSLPAVGVQVECPGHADTLGASDNWFWLEAGESRTIQVRETDGVTVSALNG